MTFSEQRWIKERFNSTRAETLRLLKTIGMLQHGVKPNHAWACVEANRVAVRMGLDKDFTIDKEGDLGNLVAVHNRALSILAALRESQQCNSQTTSPQSLDLRGTPSLLPEESTSLVAPD